MYAQVILVLAIAASPEENSSPEVWLQAASQFESQLPLCARALDAYERFFETCTDCALQQYGAERFSIAIKRCAPPDPKSIADNPANATQLEVAVLLARLVSRDPKLTFELSLRAADAYTMNDPSILNDARKRAYALLEGEPSSEAEVAALCARLRPIDEKAVEQIEHLGRVTSHFGAGGLQIARDRLVELLNMKSANPSAAKSCETTPHADPGFLTVDARPYGQIFVNGALAGDTPLAHYKVPSGCAELRVVAPDGTEKSMTVDIRPNKTNIYLIDLR
jgi:hypothetical protein